MLVMLAHAQLPKPCHSRASVIAQAAVVSIALTVPDKAAPSLMGRNSKTLEAMREATGAIITVSGYGEFVPGTRDRLVAISGGSPFVLDIGSLVFRCFVAHPSGPFLFAHAHPVTCAVL